jgi:glycosyltransferase involved in cell wall biosynthesis
VDLGHEVVVYANGESVLPCEVRALYPKGEWPIAADAASSLKDLNHTSWACADAAGDVDVVHLNNAPGLAFSRLLREPIVYTLHHAKEQALSNFYASFPDVTFVTISRFQRTLERMRKMVAIHHGIELERYPVVERKQEYLSFLGRIAPVKAPHLAIEVARKTGIPLKIAGEIQPMYRDYWESVVRPGIDGRLVEFVGEADHATKVELLGNSRAMLFPIQWNEPFGLVMIEAMACGTPVLGFPLGSVPEIIRDGVSGWICADVDEMAARARDLSVTALACREHVEEHFSVATMVRHYEAAYRSALGVHDEAPALTAPAAEHAGSVADPVGVHALKVARAMQ